MASIVKRGKLYSVVYYNGTGENRKQVWESGLSYNSARTRKAEVEHEQILAQREDIIKAKNSIDTNHLTVSDFLHEFVEKYGQKKWVASTYEASIGLMDNYIHPYIGFKKLLSIKTKTIDDYYHFLETQAKPASAIGKAPKEHITASTIHDVHKLLHCAFNLAVRWDYIHKNPAINATVPEHHEKERATLSPEQVLKVLDFTHRP